MFPGMTIPDPPDAVPPHGTGHGNTQSRPLSARGANHVTHMMRAPSLFWGDAEVSRDVTDRATIEPFYLLITPKSRVSLQPLFSGRRVSGNGPNVGGEERT